MEKLDIFQASVSLFEESMRQQQRNSDMLDSLAKVMARYESAISRYERAVAELPGQVAHQVDSVLPKAAKTAAEKIAQNWTIANDHADRATEAYLSAVRFAPWRVFSLALACIVLGAGTMIGIGCWVLPNGAASIKLLSETSRMEKNNELLRARGGDATILNCKDSEGRQRLCVRVDESAKVSARQYRVIRGY